MTTNLIIDLTWAETLNLSVGSMAEMENFEVDFYRSCKQDVHTVGFQKIDEKKKFINYLKKFRIKYTNDCERFISIYFEAEIYLSPCHHIELRVRRY